MIPGLGQSPGEGNGNPLWYYCLENSKGREAWCATVHGIAKVTHDLATKHLVAYCWGFLVALMVKNCLPFQKLPAVQEMWVRSLGQADSLEKKMATHSSVLSEKIPWAEESGRLPTMGLQELDMT